MRSLLLASLLTLPLLAPPAVASYSIDSDWVPCGCPVDWVVNPALLHVPDDVVPSAAGRTLAPVVAAASGRVADAWDRAALCGDLDAPAPVDAAWRRVATAFCDPDPVPWVCVPETRVCALA